VVDAEGATPELFEAIGMVRRELHGRAAVLGFAGAPFTVASYLIEGRPSKDYARAKGMMLGDPILWGRLMEVLTEVTVRYLRAQVAAGAQALQLFDSWAGVLSRDDYSTYVLPHTRAVFAGVADCGVPTIHFAANTGHLLTELASAGSDVVSVDWRTPLAEAWRRIGPDRAIQGNLDPAAAAAPREVALREARRVLEQAGGRPGHIFNLGHGVLPDTPADNLSAIVDLVRAGSAQGASAPASAPA
jgi:uroporphyrinogen decarboxylase